MLALLVLAVLAPSVSRILRHLSPDAMFADAVCSATMPAGKSDAAGDPASMLDCPLCLAQAQPMLPTTPADLDAVLIALGVALPLLLLRAPSRLFAWATAQPRAPPLRA